MTETAETPFQRFVGKALDGLPKTRNFYDRQLQERLSTTGKPLYDIQRRPTHSPKRETLKAIADVIGQPIDLLTRAIDGEEVEPVAVRPKATVLLEAPDIAPTRDASEGETVSITSLDLSYSMGPGTNIDGYIEENPVEMDIGFLRRITRSEFTRLRIARGVGDSMYPTLLTSDVVLIDTTQNTLSQQDRVYAISLYGASAIKRLRRIGDGKVLIVSDNPSVGNQEVELADVKIDGRVIWFGRDL